MMTHIHIRYESLGSMDLHDIRLTKRVHDKCLKPLKTALVPVRPREVQSRQGGSEAI